VTSTLGHDTNEYNRQGQASIRTIVPVGPLVDHGPSNVNSFGALRFPWITVSLKVSPSADTDRHSTRSAMP
jgi:hypothetical protein